MRKKNLDRRQRRLVDLVKLKCIKETKKNTLPKISGNNGREFGRNGLETAINFAGDLCQSVIDFDFGGESSLQRNKRLGLYTVICLQYSEEETASYLGPVEETSKHLASLVGIIVNGLLTEDDQVRLLLLSDGLQELGNTERLKFAIICYFNVDGFVGTHGQSSSQGLLRLCGSARDSNDLGRGQSFLNANGLLHGNLIKRVHAVLDIAIDVGFGRIHTNLDS